MSLSHTRTSPRRIGYLGLWGAAPITALVLIVVAMPISLVFMVLLLAILLPGAALAVVVAGLPVMAFALVAARVLAGRWVALLRLTGVTVDVAPAGESATGAVDARSARGMTMLRPLRSPSHWLALVHAVVVAPIVSVAAFTISACWTVVSVLGIFHWYWAPQVPGAGGENWAIRVLETFLPGFASNGEAAASLVYLAIGVIFLLTLPLVLRGMAQLMGGAAQALLGSDDPRPMHDG